MTGITYSPLAAIRKIAAEPARLLGFSAAASALIYLIGLVWPYNLFRWSGYSRMTLGRIMRYQLTAEIAYGLVFVSLFTLYILALRAVRTASDKRMWWLVIAGAVVFNLALLLMYPFEARDIFDNIIRGRMQAVYHANPFYETLQAFKSDPFYRYAYWKQATSAYGPLWEAIAAASAYIAGDGVIANVLVFKGVVILGYAATGWLIALILKRQAPERALHGVVLFCWNPVVLFASAGIGHNDAVLAAFILLGFYFLAIKQFTLAALAQVAGMLIKFIPALLLPIVFQMALSTLPDWKARLRFLAVTVPMCALLIIVLYAPYWRGGDVVAASRRITLFTTSLPTLVQIHLSTQLGDKASQHAVAYGALGIMMIWLAGQSGWLGRKNTLEDAVQAGLRVLLFYLLVVCLWFQPWYVVWVLPLAALTTDPILVQGTLLFSMVAHAKFPTFHFLLYRGQTVPPRVWGETWGTMLTLGLTWLYFGAAFVRKLIGQRRARPVVSNAETRYQQENSMRRALIVVAKRPAPGETKTRLSPPLSPTQAAQLYECFLQDTLNIMRSTPHVSRLIAYLPHDQAAYFRQLAPEFGLLPQQGAHLGERLDNALAHCLNDGFDQAVIMDSDSPTLPSAYLAQAFALLEDHDVVLGPCEDGGYYLIGLKAPQPRLLRKVQMSTAHVLQDTLRLAQEQQLKVALLPEWYDVDTASELEKLRSELHQDTETSSPHTLQFLTGLFSEMHP